jgi:hypothetical protein
MNEVELKKLWEQIRAKNPNFMDFSAFKSKMDTSEKRKNFYTQKKDILKRLGINLENTLDEFEKKYSTPPQPQPPQPQPPQPQPPQPQPVPTLPYSFTIAFNTSKSEPNAKQKSIDLSKYEKEINNILNLLYKNKINPKITNIDFQVEDQYDLYSTFFKVDIRKSDTIAWTEFKILGHTGDDYENKAEESYNNFKNSIPAGQKMEAIEWISSSSIPYEIYFVQIAKPKTNPPHKLKESTDLKIKMKHTLVEKFEIKERERLKNSIVKNRLSTLLESSPKKFYLNLIEEISEMKSVGLINEEDLFSNLVGIYGDNLTSLPETFFEPWIQSLIQKLDLKDSELSDFLKNKLKENPGEVWNSFVSCERMSELVAKGLCETMLYHFQKDSNHEGLEVIVEPISQVLISDEFIRKVAEQIQPMICEMFEKHSKRAEDILDKIKNISV